MSFVFLRDWIEFVNCFRCIYILIILILPIHQREKSFHFVCSWWFLSSMFCKFHSRDFFFFTYLVELICKYFNFCAAIADGISWFSCEFNISFQKPILCNIILQHETLLNCLIDSNSFLVESLGFLLYSISIICSATLGNLASSFLILMPFISFSSLIAPVESFGNVLNSSGRSGQPYLVPDLRA